MTVGTSQIRALRPNNSDLSDFQIAGAGTIIGAWSDGLGGMEGCNVQIRFALGAGSGGVSALIQSSLDQGQTYFDAVLASFGSVSRTVVFPIRATVWTPDSPPAFFEPGADGLDANGDAETEGVLCAVLGDRLRAKIVVAGTYTGQTLVSVRVMPI